MSTSISPNQPPAVPADRVDRRWWVVLAVPALAWTVGLLALPRPQGVAEAQRRFDRSALGAAVSMTPTTPAVRVDATLGGKIQVRGADLPEAALSRGSRLTLRLHFGVVAPVDTDWQVFVHIDADEGGYRINGDHWPLRGAYPTSLWQKGEYVIDTWETVVPTAAPAGPYTVWVGLYRGDERMPFSAGDPNADDGNDRIKVGSVVIE